LWAGSHTVCKISLVHNWCLKVSVPQKKIDFVESQRHSD
jgi:hypothetical protein